MLLFGRGRPLCYYQGDANSSFVQSGVSYPLKTSNQQCRITTINVQPAFHSIALPCAQKPWLRNIVDGVLSQFIIYPQLYWHCVSGSSWLPVDDVSLYQLSPLGTDLGSHILLPSSEW